MSSNIARTRAKRTRRGKCTSGSCEGSAMVFASQIVGLVRVEQSRRRPCALVRQNDRVLLLPTQGFQGSVSGQRQERRSVRNEVLFKLPCRDSNPSHRPMAYPRMGKVGCRLVQARHGPVLPPVDFTASPALSMQGRGTCRPCPRLQGVGTPPAARACPCPGLAAAGAFARPPPAYQGEAPIPVRQHAARVHSPPSGLRHSSRMRDCLWSARVYAAPRAWVACRLTFLSYAPLGVSCR
jgi:hypothetical protein